MNTSVKFVHMRKHIRLGLFAGPTRGMSQALAKGGATLAYKVNEDGTTIVGIAKCSDDDHYVKAIGRDLAASRLGQFTFPQNFNTRLLEGNFSTYLVKALQV